MDKYLEKILFIQKRIKFIYHVKKKLENEKIILYDLLKNLNKKNNENYNSNLINNFNYSNNVSQLNIFIETYTDIFNDKNTIFNKFSKIYILKNKIKKISENIGTYDLNELLLLKYNKSLTNYISNSDYSNKFRSILKIVNNHFNIIKYSFYNTKINDENQLIIYNHKENNLIDNNIFNELSDNIYFKYKKHFNIYIHNFIILYIKLDNDILILQGYFDNTIINLLKTNNYIIQKLKFIRQKSNYLKCDKKFKNNYINNIDITEIVLSSENNIINNINESYQKIITIKNQDIQMLMKDFINSNINNQYNTFKIILMMNHSQEFQILIDLFYDLVNNNSNTIYSKNLSDYLFFNLNNNLRDLLKNNYKNIEEYKRKIDTNLSISYEKQIYLMKCSDVIKQKAYDKLKEINNKNNDNCYKAQQYLNSLIKIPFNIFKTEYIFEYLNLLKEEIQFLISSIIEFKNLYGEKIDIQNLYLLSSEYYKKNMLFEHIIDYKKKITKYNKDIKKELDLNNLILTINNFIDNNSKSNIVTFIKNINKNLNCKLKINCTKNIYKSNIKNFILKLNNEKQSQLINIIHDNDLHKVYLCKDYKLIENKIYNLDKKINKYIDDRINYIQNVDNILEKAIYSQETAKIEIKRIIGQWMNGSQSGYVLGFEGPPGIGKTSLAKNGIAHCLKNSNDQSRPFSFIAIGGSCNGSFLEGHNYTYVGSNYGKIIDILINSKCMNPIIFIDELDKISKTEHGNELISILTHITDSTQNSHFNDKYFSGIDIDLSKILFIFSYNDYNNIDSILADRIHRIKFKHLSNNEKIVIIKKYIIPELLDKIGIDKNTISFSDNAIIYIINNYTYEAGVRKLKERVFEILRDVNLKYILNPNYLEKKIIINENFVKNIFIDKPVILKKTINNINKVGYVNGLYATKFGIGGITIIESFKTYSDNKLNLTITGQQGDVMKESIQCAKTIAWNIIPEKIKKSIIKDWEKNIPYGIHLNCPEASTPKDGPSAGGAITLSIISLLCNIKVKNDIALTGEIDLNGNIRQIGGLDLKIAGAKEAGVKIVLVPKENSQDIDIIKIKQKEILENINIIFIENIWNILDISLEKHDLKFNSF